MQHEPPTIPEELDLAIRRAGYAVLPAEVAQFVAQIVCRGGQISYADFNDLMDCLGFTVCEPYDPARHGEGELSPGEPFFVFSNRMQAVMHAAGPHMPPPRKERH